MRPNPSGMYTMSPAIIGVVGSSNVDVICPSMRKLLKSAWRVGRLIAAEGHIVLTGGHHKVAEHSVKHFALLGAFDSEGTERRVGVIGIPPAHFSTSKHVKISARRNEKYAPDDGSLGWVYIHTLYDSEKRNPLNGKTPDVMIALSGGPGTVQEMQEALNVGRRVILLKPYSDEQQKILSCHPEDVFEVGSESEAVEKAIALVGKGEFPGSYRNLGMEFCLEARKEIAFLRDWVAETPRRKAANPAPAADG